MSNNNLQPNLITFFFESFYRRCFVKTIQMAVSQRLLPLRCVICRAKILRLKQTLIPRDVSSTNNEHCFLLVLTLSPSTYLPTIPDYLPSTYLLPTYLLPTYLPPTYLLPIYLLPTYLPPTYLPRYFSPSSKNTQRHVVFYDYFLMQSFHSEFHKNVCNQNKTVSVLADVIAGV